MEIYSPLGRGDCRRQAWWVSVRMAFPIRDPPLAFGRPLRRRGFFELCKNVRDAAPSRRFGTFSTSQRLEGSSNPVSNASPPQSIHHR